MYFYLLMNKDFIIIIIIILLMNNLLQSNSFNTDIEGGHRKCQYYRDVRIKRDEFVDKLRAFFRQGQSRLSV